VNVQSREFDINFGIHFTSQIVNPNYLRRPKTLLKASKLFPFLPFEKRTEFAISIMSDCGVSFRNDFLLHLQEYLGESRVHRFGDCGNRKLPPKPIQNAARVISRYKFYLSFENNIQDGYVTEKLFTVLNMQILPVYLGAMNAPNITVTPSYIRASDYASPKELAKYLIYLADHADEYAKYHSWRNENAGPVFDPSYLRLVAKKYPGKRESQYHRSRRMSRRSTCCRLCDLALLDRLSEERASHAENQDVVRAKWTELAISQRIFHRGRKRPGPGSVIPR
jgi:hypothetical protein